MYRQSKILNIMIAAIGFGIAGTFFGGKEGAIIGFIIGAILGFLIE